MTADGYLRSVLVDGARKFRYRPGVAGLLGHVSTDLDVVFVAPPGGPSFPTLRHRIRHDHRTPTTYSAGDYVRPGYTEILAPQPESHTTDRAPFHAAIPDAATPAPNLIPQPPPAPIRSQPAAEPPLTAAAPAAATPSRIATIVLPPVASSAAPAHPPETSRSRRAADDPIPTTTVIADHADPKYPPATPTAMPRSAAVQHHSRVADSIGATPAEGADSSSTPPSDAVEPSAAGHHPLRRVRRDATHTPLAVPQAARRTDEDAAATTEFSIELVDEPDAVTPQPRRLPAWRAHESAPAPFDAATWRPMPDDPAGPPPEAATAPAQHMAVAPIVIVDTNAPAGITGFWVRKHLSRLRPRLLR